jgi:CDP-diacylglycerol--serine O-phosphatidyltransferase
LAKFNIDPRQSHGFLGLPTPANALFWAGLVLGVAHKPHLLPPFPSLGFHLFWWALVALVPMLSALMLSELPLPSLKLRHRQVQGNEVVVALAVIGIVLLLAFGFLAVPLLVILYLLSPLWGKLFPKPV